MVGLTIIINKQGHVAGHLAIGAKAGEKRIGAGHLVGDGYTASSCLVSLAFEFQVKPHDKFLRGGVVNHLGSLEYATFGDVAVGVI